MRPDATLILSRSEVAQCLGLPDCIAAVEDAFRAHALGRCQAGILGTHVEGGGFHVKAAAMAGDAPVYALKVNGNFFGNEARGMPRIQGVIVLCDATHGYPLAIMDSTLITQLRTGAATAVAAKYLARPGAAAVTVAGCGLQGRVQLRSVAAVRPVTHVFAYDAEPARAQRFAAEMRAEGFDVTPVAELAEGTRQSGIVVTCTPSCAPIVREGDVGAGTFIAAVGADSEQKQEIDPALMARAAVVPDILEQAATIGDLHHAITAGVMRREDARAELGAIVAGVAAGRRDDGEIVIFDSTGSALQDVAAASMAYQRATRSKIGARVNLLQ